MDRVQTEAGWSPVRISYGRFPLKGGPDDFLMFINTRSL